MMYHGLARKRLSGLHILSVEYEIIHELLNVAAGDLIDFHVAYCRINTLCDLLHTLE